MDRFDDSIYEAIYEVAYEDLKEQQSRERARRKRAEEMARKMKSSMIFLGIFSVALVAVLLWCVSELNGEAEDIPTRVGKPCSTVPYPTVDAMPEPTPVPQEEPEPVAEVSHIRDDIPMDAETQELLWAACEETGVPYTLALAVVRQESDFKNIVGDRGNSIGYMQVQPQWHGERMARLGVTDLRDPGSNFRVGCDLLAELMKKYTVEEALTAYNSGRAGHSAYADKVISYWEELMK